jgi:transposase
MRRIEFLDTEIAAVERLIAQDALDSPEIRRLMSVPGVNVIVAASFLAAIGDIDRFKSPRGVSELLDRIAIPQPWRGTVEASLALIEDLERQIDEINHELRSSGVDHRYVPLLLTVPGIAWVLAFTIAAEIGDIERFAMAKKLVGYTGLCPRVNQSGDKDRRGPLSKHGTRCLRWAMLEATMHALRHPVYCERYQRNKQRLGRQRGAKVAQIDIARRLTEAIWHMLTTNQPCAPTAAAGGAALRLAA